MTMNWVIPQQDWTCSMNIALMKIAAIVLASLLAAALTLPAAAQDAKAPPAPAAPAALKDPQAQIAYAIGLNLGAGLKRESVTVDPDIVARGVRDGLSGGPALMTEDQARAALGQLQANVKAQREEKARHASETNKAEGAAFLQANAAKPGVVTLPGGLQYEILTAGGGPKPKAGDVVVCNYRGTLLDGTEFDSSYKRGEPSAFPVAGVIKGWTMALERMPVGSKWRLVVPSDLAYGEKGAGDDIGPNAVLIFEVELLAIQPKGR
jgi:FKBP-type peptidyl-prolyl cis-trans isomerase